MPHKRRVLGWLWSAVGFALIAATTLTPLPVVNQVGLEWWHSPSVSDVLRNVLLYVPLGFGLRQAGVRGRPSLLLCCALSLTVELAQISAIAGRNASANDVLANTAGAAVGIWVAARWSRLVWPDRLTRSRLFYLWASVLLAVFFATTLGERPSLPDGSYRVRWAPQGFGRDWFHGQLLSASVAGTALQDNGSPPTNEPGAKWLGRGLALTARFVPGPPLTEESGIVGIADIQNREIIELAQEGADLQFRVRTLAARVGLASPTVVLRNELTMRAQSGRTDTVSVAAGLSRGQLSLLAVSNRGERSSTLILSPSLGWLMLSPWQSWTTQAIRWVSALWLMVLVFPIGYWGAWKLELFTDSLVAIIVLVVALAAAPALAGTHSGTWWDWTAAIAGSALGASVRATAVRLRDQRSRQA